MTVLSIAVFSLLGALATLGMEPEVFGAAPVASPQAGKMEKLLATLQEVRRKSAPAVLHKLDKLDAEVGKLVRSTVHDAPSWIFEAVTDAALQSAKRLGKTPVVNQLQELERRTVVHNLAGAEKAVGAVSRILRASPEVRTLTNRALEILDQQGILGDSALKDAAFLLGAVGAGYAFARQKLKTGGFRLVLPLGVLSLSKLGNYQTVLRLRNPLWTKSAVEVSLRGHVPLKATGPSAGPVTAEEAKVKLGIPLRYPTRAGRKTLLVSPYVAHGRERDARGAGVELRGRF